MRYAPLPGVRINREHCPKCRDYKDVASWWVSISGYEHVEHKCLHCLHRWPDFVHGDHPDLLKAIKRIQNNSLHLSPETLKNHTKVSYPQTGVNRV